MDPSSGAPRPEPKTQPELTPVAADEAGDPAGAGVGMATAHLARFEFSDAGTKILMVEWLPGAAVTADAATGATDAIDAQAQAQSQSQSQHQPAVTPTPPAVAPESSAPRAVSSGSAPDSASGHRDSGPALPGTVSGADAAPWEVSWPGKSTFLPARDADLDVSSDSPEAQRRRVFFLLPPDAPVPPTVTITPPGRAPIKVKPLPAIFPDGFGDAEASRPGSRGVLHTIWAKKRLRELEREMDAELRTNAESVGLEMALAEKQWIIDSFLRPPPLNIATAVESGHGPATPLTPSSPTGRLGEKLKGLRLATSPADLAPSPTANTFTSAGSQSHTLSPKEGDMAVSSFSAISRPPVPAAAPTPVSLNAAMHRETVGARETDEDDLFALPMSPRSPDMKKSLFSTL